MSRYLEQRTITRGVLKQSNILIRCDGNTTIAHTILSFTARRNIQVATNSKSNQINKLEGLAIETVIDTHRFYVALHLTFDLIGLFIVFVVVGDHIWKEESYCRK